MSQKKGKVCMVAAIAMLGLLLSGCPTPVVTPSSYTVTFDSQSATVVAYPTSKTATYGGNIGTLPSSPTRTGNVFSGWYTQTNGGGTEFTANTAVTGDITVYAKWTINTYTITFDSQSATVAASPTSKTATFGSNIGSLPTPPTKTGYTFGGWWTATNGGGTQFTASTTMTADITVYAEWTINTYTITFDSRSATVAASPTSKKATFGGNVGTLPTPPIKTGYTFAGWYTQTNGGGTEFTASTAVTADITVYAKWSTNPVYTITFDSQGATVAVNPSTITVTLPATTVGTLPTPPTKTGYTFSGWWIAINGGGTQFTASTTVTASITVYAKWTINTYTITFDSQSATVAASPTSKTATYGGSIGSLPTPPTKTGYTFGGWWTAIIGGGTQFTASTTVTADTTVYAKWTGITCTVTFDSQSATVASSPTSKTATYGGNVGTLPSSPAKTGYAFSGWYTQTNGGGTEFTAYTAVTADITVYAKWAINTYTITFDSQSATVASSPTSKTATYGGNVGSLPTPPTKTGYTFGGWWTATNGGGTQFTASTSVTADINVYAKWTINTYTITFDSQSATVTASPTSKTATYGGNVGSLPTPPTKTGYYFGGWWTAINGGGSSFTASTVVTANITVYASWGSSQTTLVLRELPTQAKLIVNTGATYRLAFGMGPSLPYNTWTPWEIADSNPVWMSFVAEAGKTYSVYWDDNYQGSLTNGVKTYSGDLLVGGYASDKTTRLSGWSTDTDSGYTTAKTLSVTSTQLVYLKVVPYSSANMGTYAVRVVEAGSSSGDAYAWYKDGVPISGAADYVYTVDPASLTAGLHRFTCVGSREGVIFSESYDIQK